ncbi:MAG: LCP family protein [Clostridiales bacterium]|nr:LCP family protein [Candidatus Equinaster intestinalis]
MEENKNLEEIANEINTDTADETVSDSEAQRAEQQPEAEEAAAEQAAEDTQAEASEDMEDIVSHSPKKKHKKLKIILIIISVLLILAIAAGIVGNMYINHFLNENVNRDNSFNENNLGINSEVFKDESETSDPDEGDNKYENFDGCINIALFGLDTRSDGFKGRSDSIIILTIDKKRNKIKMTSLARDSYVAIDGHGKSKLGHAYAYGNAELAVKTINQSFNMDIKDYVTVNFFGFAKLIDYLGGIDVYIDPKVLNEVNNMSGGELGEAFEYEAIPGTGKQHLNGKQALSYARTRHNTGGDLGRASRQREVLDVSLQKARELGIGNLTEFIKIGLQNSQTSLTVDEIKDLGTWALLNEPTIETYAVPDKDCHPKSGKDCYIGKTWYYIYDLDIATKKIHDFIKEEGTYTPPVTSENP